MRPAWEFHFGIPHSAFCGSIFISPNSKSQICSVRMTFISSDLRRFGLFSRLNPGSAFWGFIQFKEYHKEDFAHALKRNIL